MSVSSVLTGLLNDIAAAKRKLPQTETGVAAVYKRLNQAEGLVNGALNKYWRAKTRPKPKKS
jgi:hypothetical protein